MKYPERLFHFGEYKYLHDFVSEGHISFGNAEIFPDNKLTDDQRDNEKERMSRPEAGLLRFTLSPAASMDDSEESLKALHEALSSNGGCSNLPLGHVGIIRRMPSGRSEEIAVGRLQSFVSRLSIPYDYYIKSFTIAFDATFYDSFPGDTCIEIVNPKELISRLFKQNIPIQGKCQIGFGNVKYYDETSECLLSAREDPVFYKASKYSHQREYRIAIRTELTADLPQRLSVKLGDLSDIAVLHRKHT